MNLDKNALCNPGNCFGLESFRSLSRASFVFLPQGMLQVQV